MDITGNLNTFRAQQQLLEEISQTLSLIVLSLLQLFIVKAVISSEFPVKSRFTIDTFTVWTDPVSGGQTCQLKMLVQRSVTAMILYCIYCHSWSLQRLPLKPIIYLQMLTNSQFVFVFVLRVRDRHHQKSSFGLRTKINKAPTHGSNPSDAQEKAEG